MLSWQAGAVKITCVVETLIPFPYHPQGFCPIRERNQ
jgi:hypothetical protein